MLHIQFAKCTRTRLSLHDDSCAWSRALCWTFGWQGNDVCRLAVGHPPLQTGHEGCQLSKTPHTALRADHGIIPQCNPGGKIPMYGVGCSNFCRSVTAKFCTKPKTVHCISDFGRMVICGHAMVHVFLFFPPQVRLTMTSTQSYMQGYKPKEWCSQVPRLMVGWAFIIVIFFSSWIIKNH